MIRAFSRRKGLYIYALIIFAFLYAPLIALSVVSFQGGPTLWHWYGKAFSDPLLVQALNNSLLIGAGAMVLSTILGTTAALALRHRSFPGQAMIDTVLNLPLVLPEIVMGLSMLVWFVFIDLTLGILSVTLAHATFCVPYVILMVSTRLKSIDPVLEEAAADLGSTPWTTFWRIIFPLILPAVVASALLAFTISFDDFLITFFTGGIGSDTLPVRIYSMMRFGVKPEMNAISTAVIFFTLGAVLVVSRLKRDH
jgi:spermidine/putrescine transport system permease protein